MQLRLVLFDVDGVLLDSLPQHLSICADLAQLHGLQLHIPDEVEMKRKVRAGARISPMREFFREVGFPAEVAALAEAEYQASFGRRYRSKLFPGAVEMLKSLGAISLQTGLVTANYRSNIAPALGDVWRLFSTDGIMCVDDYEKHAWNPFSKAAAIAEVMRRIGALPGETLYIGDQESDWEGAQGAGVAFIGARYGWGIFDEERRFPTVRSLAEIPARVAMLSGLQREAVRSYENC